jgi:Ser/Thr protein kinase RdoA (MazF antagonist)
LLARLGQALRGFDHPASYRTLIWDLRRLPGLLTLLPQIAELPQRQFLADFLARFESSIVPPLDTARRQVVHNDFNARNIIVDSQQQSRVTGIIDFGDAVHTALAADVAIGVIGQLATAATADESIDEFVSAYCEIVPLTAEELALLDWLIAGRIVQNTVLVAWHRSRCPQGEHFDGFDAEFFAWRIELAQRLISRPPARYHKCAPHR